MTFILLVLLVAPFIAANAEEAYIKSFLTRIAEEQCLSSSGSLIQDELDATHHGFLDKPQSTRYPLLNSELALILRNALGVSYNFSPETPRSQTPKSYTSEEAVRMLKSCQAQEALYNLYNTQRFIPNSSIEGCTENAYYIYYEDKLTENLMQVENLDSVGALDNTMASDCAINVMNVFAKHFVQKKHSLKKKKKKSHNTYDSKIKIDLNGFKAGTEWIELQKLVREDSKVECTEETSTKRPVCTIFS